LNSVNSPAVKLYFFVKIFCYICLFSEATTTANNDNDNDNNDSGSDKDKPNEETTPEEQPSDEDEKTAAVIVPENGAAVKFVSDGDVATSSRNGPTDVVPSTSVDAVVETAKTDEDKKSKEEKPKAVGIFELVRFFCL